ncbi:MAG TPA: hypothetical protein VF433_03020 [Cellvibrio sp.]
MLNAELQTEHEQALEMLRSRVGHTVGDLGVVLRSIALASRSKMESMDDIALAGVVDKKAAMALHHLRELAKELGVA